MSSHYQMNEKCSSCQNMSRRLRICEADIEHQRKRYQQDKHKHQVQYQQKIKKLMKKLNDQLEKEKQARKRQNECWQKKVDEVNQKFKFETQQFKLVKEKETENFLQKKEIQVQTFKSEKIIEFEKSISLLHKQMQDQKRQLVEQKQKQVQKVNQSYVNQMVALSKIKQDEKEKQINKLKSVIMGLESSKNVDQNLHQKDKEQSKKKQFKLQSEIYTLKKDITEKDSKIKELKKEIKERCEKIQQLKHEFVELQKSYLSNCNKLDDQYNTKLNEYRVKASKQVEKMLKKQLQNCSQFEKKITQIDTIREKQNKMLQANIEDMRDLMDKGKNQSENISQEMIYLKDKLQKKDIEIKVLKQNLRKTTLELKYFEDVQKKFNGSQQLAPPPHRRLTANSVHKNVLGSIENLLNNQSQLQPIIDKKRDNEYQPLNRDKLRG